MLIMNNIDYWNESLKSVPSASERERKKNFRVCAFFASMKKKYQIVISSKNIMFAMCHAKLFPLLARSPSPLISKPSQVECVEIFYGISYLFGMSEREKVILARTPIFFILFHCSYGRIFFFWVVNEASRQAGRRKVC